MKQHQQATRKQGRHDSQQQDCLQLLLPNHQNATPVRLCNRRSTTNKLPQHKATMKNNTSTPLLLLLLLVMTQAGCHAAAVINLRNGKSIELRYDSEVRRERELAFNSLGCDPCPAGEYMVSPCAGGPDTTPTCAGMEPLLSPCKSPTHAWQPSPCSPPPHPVYAHQPVEAPAQLGRRLWSPAVLPMTVCVPPRCTLPVHARLLH